MSQQIKGIFITNSSVILLFFIYYALINFKEIINLNSNGEVNGKRDLFKKLFKMAPINF